MCCKYYLGPSFGWLGTDIYGNELAVASPFNGEKNCKSKLKDFAYDIPMDKDRINMLTG
jgi:hypothetical protein